MLNSAGVTRLNFKNELLMVYGKSSLIHIARALGELHKGSKEALNLAKMNMSWMLIVKNWY